MSKPGQRSASDKVMYHAWKKACVDLHNAEPGVGLWYRGRLNVFMGLRRFQTGGGQERVGPRWWGRCCSCGDYFFRQSVGPDAASTLRPDGPKPDFSLSQRCDECKDPGGRPRPTSLGFEPAALKRLQEWGCDWQHRPDLHYVVFRNEMRGIGATPPVVITSDEISEHRRLTILTSLL